MVECGGDYWLAGVWSPLDLANLYEIWLTARKQVTLSLRHLKDAVKPFTHQIATKKAQMDHAILPREKSRLEICVYGRRLEDVHDAEELGAVWEQKLRVRLASKNLVSSDRWRPAVDFIDEWVQSEETQRACW